MQFRIVFPVTFCNYVLTTGCMATAHRLALRWAENYSVGGLFTENIKIAQSMVDLGFGATKILITILSTA